jgi:hypothetical protein
VAFLNWHFGLTQMTAWRIEVAPVSGLSNVYTCEDPSSPSQSLYMDMGMVMIREKGGPRDGAMGGSIVSVSATKSDADAKSAPATLLQIHPLLLS